MDKVNVMADTLSDLSVTLKNKNEKLLNILSSIVDTTINYQDMLISEAGDLFRDFIIKEQESEKTQVLLNNQEISDKLTYIADVYNDTNSKIGGLMNNG